MRYVPSNRNDLGMSGFTALARSMPEADRDALQTKATESLKAGNASATQVLLSVLAAKGPR
jgi:hypothetical protein